MPKLVHLCIYPKIYQQRFLGKSWEFICSHSPHFMPLKGEGLTHFPFSLPWTLRIHSSYAKGHVPCNRSPCHHSCSAPWQCCSVLWQQIQQSTGWDSNQPPSLALQASPFPWVALEKYTLEWGNPLPPSLVFIIYETYYLDKSTSIYVFKLNFKESENAFSSQLTTIPTAQSPCR